MSDGTIPTGRLASAPSRARWWLAGAVLLALAARLAFGFLYWTGKPLTQDEREYLQLGRSLADGKGFAYQPDPTAPSGHRSFSRAPAYPLFLAGVFWLADRGRPAAARSQPVGDSSPASDTTPRAGDDPTPGDGTPAGVPASVKIAQSLVGAIGVLVLAMVARRAAGEPTGIIAAYAAALYPPLVWTASYAFSETLFLALALGAVLLLSPALDDGHDRPWWRLLAAGLLGGAATLTRPAMLFFLALVAVWLLRRRRLAAVLVLATGAVIVVAPWTARNAAVHGRFVLVAAEGGVTFWTGNHPLAIGEGDMAANPAIKREFRQIEARYPGLTNEEIEGVYYREALAYIIGHPGRWVWLVARKAFYTVVPVGPSYRLHSMRYYVLSLVSYLLVLPPGLAGFLRLRRQGSSPVALALFAASALLVSLVFFPQERFRISAIDPVLVAWSSAWAAAMVGATARPVVHSPAQRVRG